MGMDVGLATQGASASEAMGMTSLSRNIPVSVADGFICIFIRNICHLFDKTIRLFAFHVLWKLLSRNNVYCLITNQNTNENNEGTHFKIRSKLMTESKVAENDYYEIKLTETLTFN